MKMKLLVCGVMLWIDSDLGYESGVFGVNGVS